MANTTQSTNQLWRGPGIVLLAAYGSVAVDELGYTRGPVTINRTVKVNEDQAQEVTLPIDELTESEALQIEGMLAQFNADTLAYATGLTISTRRFDFGGQPEENEYAIRLIGTAKNGMPIHVVMPRARPVQSMKLDIQRGKNVDLAFSFHALHDTTVPNIIMGPATVTSATIATGTFARTNATPTAQLSWYKLSGEGAAADSLADITGATTLVTSEVIRLQLTTVAQPITITHASGIIELKTAADFVLTKLADWIDFYYDLANTAWKELARYDP